MNQYVVDLIDETTPAFLEALRRDFGKIICFNESIWMMGEPKQEQKILDHAAATGVRLNLVHSFWTAVSGDACQISTTASDDTWQTTTTTTGPSEIFLVIRIY